MAMFAHSIYLELFIIELPKLSDVKINGVKKVLVDLDSKTVSIEADDKLDQEIIKTVINDNGYNYYLG